MKFKRFTKPQFLKGIGRELLGKLFGIFTGVKMPAPELDDDNYFKAVSGVAMSPEGLPDEMVETLFTIEEMSNDEGTERLKRGIAQAGVAVAINSDSSHGDFVVQVCLAAPELLTEKHNEQRLLRLATFEYFGAKEPVDRSQTFGAPAQAVLDLVTKDCDDWFKENERGDQTTNIQVYTIDAEIWFLVRHGDTYARVAKVENRRLEMMHFRPAKDDVIVYSPKRDELRIHTGTKGERELYQRVFGQRLHGDDKYFSERKLLTLEPLRTAGADALEGIVGISRIVLREIEVAWDGEFHESMTRRADDIFAAAEARSVKAIPDGGRLVRAAFDFYFGECKKPRRVTIRPPNIIKLGRHCDAALVQRLLSERGFRAVANSDALAGGDLLAALIPTISHVEPVALP